MAFFIQCKFIKTQTVFRTVFEQSNVPEKTWARLTSFFAIKLCLQTLVKSRASRDWQPHNSQHFRSICLEHRSWKITIKSQPFFKYDPTGYNDPEAFLGWADTLWVTFNDYSAVNGDRSRTWRRPRRWGHVKNDTLWQVHQTDAGAIRHNCS